MNWMRTSAPDRPYRNFVLNEPHKAKRIRTLVNRGRHLLEAGLTDEARRQFLQALNVYPHVTPALNSLAIIALNEGDVDRALDVLHEALQSDPCDPIAHALAAQCWQSRESDPLMQGHVNAALEAYLQLIAENDPLEPDYSEFALYFVMQALVLAEDDAGLIRLYEAQVTRDWDSVELTWFGIAYFNQGVFDQAYRLWGRASQQQFPPAAAYAALADHVIHRRVLPFRLDYELISLEDAMDFPYMAYSLLTVHAINGVFEAPSLEAQALIAYLVEHEMPGLGYFLSYVMRDERLPVGVRLLAAAQLLWSAEEPLHLPAEIEALAKQRVPADARIARHLLLAARRRQEGYDRANDVQRHLQLAHDLAQRTGEEWAVEMAEDWIAEFDDELDELEQEDEEWY